MTSTEIFAAVTSRHSAVETIDFVEDFARLRKMIFVEDFVEVRKMISAEDLAITFAGAAAPNSAVIPVSLATVAPVVEATISVKATGAAKAIMVEGTTAEATAIARWK